MNTHEQYEELCALAATGQASDEELAYLRSHLEGCPSCRAVAYDFSELSAQGLSALAAKRLHCQIPTGMAQRFVARAHSEGIEISEAVTPKRTCSDRIRSPFRLIAAGALAATVLFCSSLILLKLRKPSFPDPAHIVSTKATPSGVAAPHQDTEGDSYVKDELLAAHKRLSALEDTLKEQRAELESLKADKSAVSAQLAEARQQSSGLQREKADQDVRLRQLDAELQKAISEKEATATALATQEVELREVQSRVAEQSQALREQEALSAKGSDVRDLVVARNLHIIDVHDRDGNGKNQRTFGRIFYTEGKSLIFYAYDLTDPRKLNAKVSFQVWGERLGSEKPIRSLGILHNDDVSDGRWILAFDDPQVLAQIDSVFVTAEPSQKLANEPHGEKILFAFLGGRPNHP